MKKFLLLFLFFCAITFIFAWSVLANYPIVSFLDQLQVYQGASSGLFVVERTDSSGYLYISRYDVINAPQTWVIGGITGSGRLVKNTTYYSNPVGDTTSPSAVVVDGECQFTFTNTSTIATDIYVDMADFTGGDAMANTNLGTSNTTAYGAYSYYSGMNFADKVIAKSSGSSVLKSNLAAGTNLKWGLQVTTKTNDWVSVDLMTTSANIRIVAH